MTYKEQIQTIINEWLDDLDTAHRTGLLGTKLNLYIDDRGLIEEDMDFVAVMVEVFGILLSSEGYRILIAAGWVDGFFASLKDKEMFEGFSSFPFELAEQFLSVREYDEFLDCAGLQLLIEWDEGTGPWGLGVKPIEEVKENFWNANEESLQIIVDAFEELEEEEEEE